MAGSFVRRQDNSRKRIPFRCSIRLTALFSVRGRFLVPSTVHFSAHLPGHVRSLSAGLWRKLRKAKTPVHGHLAMVNPSYSRQLGIERRM